MSSWVETLEPYGSQRVLIEDPTMTAIGVVGIESGFVIAADGRMTLDDEARRATTPAATLELESEEAQKIFVIADKEKTLAYATAGFVKIDDFSVLDALKRKMATLANRNFDTCKKYFEAVAERLADELNEAKRAKLIDKLPAYRKMEIGGGWKILDVVLAGYFKNYPCLTIAQLSHTDGLDVHYNVNSHPPNYCILLGSDAVRRAMYPNPGGEADARFSPYAVKTPITSQQDGEEYVTGFIAACSSDLGREIDPETWRITGGKTHVAKITPQSGFEWIIPPSLVTVSTGSKMPPHAGITAGSTR